MKKINFAYTLAEVLVTIGVIGVVSAITLPSLIKNYNNYITAQKLKKAYHTLSNGIKMAEVEYGPIKDWSTDGDMREYYNKYFQPYFKGIKLCSSTYNCGYKGFDKNKWTGANWGVETGSDRLLFKLIDGTVIFYPTRSGNTKVYYFYVDINGIHKPNELNKDVYKFERNTNKGITLVEKGLEIMKNGWKIKD